MRRFTPCLAAFFLFTLAIFSQGRLPAQELDCDVTVNFEQLTETPKENLSDFAQQVRYYLNNYRWTKEDFEGDKIKCTINIFFQGTKGDNHFIAQAFIGSQRPVYSSDRNTALLRVMDEKWEFDYIRNQPLAHDEMRFDPMLSFLDFYAQIILGLDFDSYKAGDGTPFFQKGIDIVNRARGNSLAGRGWEPAQQGAYSRATLVDELLNPKFRTFREAFYKYHYKGLDWLADKPEKGKQTILTSLESIAKLQEKINQRSLLINQFFDNKHREIAATFHGYSEPGIYDKLARIDPQHQNIYEEYSKKPLLNEEDIE